jgi:hypothetical protein
MFISRKHYDDLIEAKGALAARVSAFEAETNALRAQVIAQQTAADWYRVRLTQLEYERAQLIQRYMGISVPVPQFDKSVDDRPDPNQTIDFNDVGDDVAKALGIDWNPDGTLRYAK